MTASRRSGDGFSLIETIIAMGILATSLLGLAAVFQMGLQSMAASSPAVVAREKAREAVESVHTARDTRTLTWANIRNKSQGGVFKNGAQNLYLPGDDGLINTDDDEDLEKLIKPGHDEILGTEDDVEQTLDNFTREIEITDVLDPDGSANPNLRQIRVIVRYMVLGTWRTYTVTTFISSYS